MPLGLGLLLVGCLNSGWIASVVIIRLLQPVLHGGACDTKDVSQPAVDNLTWVCFGRCNAQLARASITSFGHCSAANKQVVGDLQVAGARQIPTQRFSSEMESRWAKSIGAMQCRGICLHIDGDVLLLRPLQRSALLMAATRAPIVQYAYHPSAPPGQRGLQNGVMLFNARHHNFADCVAHWQKMMKLRRRVHGRWGSDQVALNMVDKKTKGTCVSPLPQREYLGGEMHQWRLHGVEELFWFIFGSHEAVFYHLISPNNRRSWRWGRRVLEQLALSTSNYKSGTTALKLTHQG